jgi:hypothetical protein
VHVPIARSDAKLLIVAAGAVVLAGLLVAAVLLLATSRATSPTKPGPFDAGVAKSIKDNLKDGGPYFVPDPFGGNRNILLALEDGEIVALSEIRPGTTSCHIRWKGSINSFVDCNDKKLTSRQLDRFPAQVAPAGRSKGDLFIDVRQKEPAPEPASS